MSVDLYVSRVREPDPKMPLIFAFHGTGGDENQLFSVAEQIAPGAGVISPRGDRMEAGAARFFRRTAEGVYDMADLCRATAKMTSFVDAYRALYSDRQVYAFGYSNGANILASVFFNRPALFDRVGLLHPLINWELNPQLDLKQRPVLVSAGRRDPITPWNMSAHLIKYLVASDADVRTEVHDGGHELRNSELTALQTLFSND